MDNVQMMRQQHKRRGKCRTSRQYCQEKLCCPRPVTEAAYFCRDCNSAQCQDCDKDIHSRKVSFEFHDRRTIEPQPENQLCQANVLNIVCKERNFADIWCENCRVTFCFDCYSAYHQNRKQQHINISFANYQKREREKVGADKVAAAAATQLTIKPISPLGDDNLTFCSFPQNSVPEETLQTELSEFNSAKMTMASNPSVSSSGHSMPDLCPGAENLLSKELDYIDTNDDTDSVDGPTAKSFLLVDDREELQVKDEEAFIQNLGCSKDARVKILSIFGNTGDGKSHTLNHTFFNGRKVFQTSASQNSCTLGVWAAFDHHNNVITIDTEGLLGSSANDNKRTRLLLKILAISDIVVFRTRAERLHKDMFVFLSNASKAYRKHFSEELRAASKKYQIKESNLGPTLIVFQETSCTAPLQSDSSRSPDALLRDMFVEKKCEIEAFSEICYVGIRTGQYPTNFQAFRSAVLTRLKDHSIRATRPPHVMFQSLKALNRKFSGTIENVREDTFPEQYFTCTATCQACQSRCVLTMNHDTETMPHDAGRDVNCRFEVQLGNKIYLCKKCSLSGRRNVVVPKTSESNTNALFALTNYIISGFVMECATCGVIFRSRQHWYGNPEPESVVVVEVRHIWPEGNRSLQGTHNAARKLVDGISYVAGTISSVSAKPAKLLSECIADQIAPSYWVPNSQITCCKGCDLVFTTNEQKHHCRACGRGFCDECSSKKRPVPERGWNNEPVRVCDACYAGNGADVTRHIPLHPDMISRYSEMEISTNLPVPKPEDNMGVADDAQGHELGEGETALTARKVGEAVTSTFGVIASALDYPRNILKDSARPEYWVPDDQIKACVVCQEEFTIKRPIHHCRACGQGVCDDCSPGRRPVPLRGWDNPVRVCNKCENKTEEF